MKNILLITVLLLFVSNVFGQQQKNKNAKYEIEVNGNCDMCKKRIEKAALGVQGVKVAQWHDGHQHLHVTLNENKCDIMQVHQAVAAVGHDTDQVKAKDEVYEKLHHCCLYERKN